MANDVVSVAQNAAGRWMLTLNGTLVGDSRPQPTRDIAIAYAKERTKKWVDVEYDFADVLAEDAEIEAYQEQSKK